MNKANNSVPFFAIERYGARMENIKKRFSIGAVKRAALMKKRAALMKKRDEWEATNGDEARKAVSAVLSKFWISARVMKGYKCDSVKRAMAADIESVIAALASENIRAVSKFAAKVSSGEASVLEGVVIGGEKFNVAIKIGNTFTTFAAWLLKRGYACEEAERIANPHSENATVKAAARLVLMLEEIGKSVKVWGEIRDAVEAEREKAKKAKAKAMRNEAKKMAKSSDPVIRANAELVKTEAEKVEKAA